jgi:hypothetical protein
MSAATRGGVLSAIALLRFVGAEVAHPMRSKPHVASSQCTCVRKIQLDSEIARQCEFGNDAAFIALLWATVVWRQCLWAGSVALSRVLSARACQLDLGADASRFLLLNQRDTLL